MKRKTKKKMKKSPEPEFVTARTEYVRGRNVRRYYAAYDGGHRLVRITKRRHDRAVARKRKLDLRIGERKLGGKRGDHGVVPGAGHAWPMRCEALACHPSQVAAFNERNKRHGINVQYSRSGMAVVPDEAAYRRLRKAERAPHRNSYNG